jgi:hypothetical protein
MIFFIKFGIGDLHKIYSGEFKFRSYRSNTAVPTLCDDQIEFNRFPYKGLLVHMLVNIIFSFISRVFNDTEVKDYTVPSDWMIENNELENM